ncbi:hypothetical protein ACTWQF_18175 [Streptomyces sp. 8N114]|uniref:hypothetical protein n=1 Tax=Streptomyces sp. 8N114 TaxID=3457419 RepID=UPI003FD289C0
MAVRHPHPSFRRGAALGLVAFQVGQRVWGLPGFSFPRTATAATDYVLVEPKKLAPAPVSLDFASMAALPCTALTALQTVRDILELREGRNSSSSAPAARAPISAASWVPNEFVQVGERVYVLVAKHRRPIFLNDVELRSCEAAGSALRVGGGGVLW